MIKITKKAYINLFLFAIFAFIIPPSCKKLIDIAAPVNSISSANVFTNDETAIAVLTGLYTDMSQSTGIFHGNLSNFTGLTVATGLTADELIYHGGLLSPKFIAFYMNNLSATGSPVAGTEFWNLLYFYIFRCNSAIEGLSDPSADVLISSVRNQLLGEAKFLRAFFYFYLTNLYGDVPLIITTDYKINTLLSKSPTDQIYQQIVTDLEDAIKLLSDNYLSSNLLQGTTERVRPTKWTATALLSRVYLYQRSYEKAEAATSALIENTSFELLPLNSVFTKNSKEAIWQLQPTTVYFNTDQARLFIIPANGPNSNNPVYLSDQLLQQFEPGDKRAEYGNWIDSTIYKVNATINDTVYFSYKYKKNLLDSSITGSSGMQKMTEYTMVLRLGEQYLIRAEARARQNKITEAKADLNAIRERAGLTPTTANDLSSLIDAILHERFVELFSEWGHRWFDLKRTGRVDAVMSIVTPLKSSGVTNWQSYQQLYPIPQDDINKAPNLIQNTGY